MNKNLTPFGNLTMNAGVILIIIGVVAGLLGNSDLGWTAGGLGVVLVIFMSFFK